MFFAGNLTKIEEALILFANFGENNNLLLKATKPRGNGHSRERSVTCDTEVIFIGEIKNSYARRMQNDCKAVRSDYHVYFVIARAKLAAGMCQTGTCAHSGMAQCYQFDHAKGRYYPECVRLCRGWHN